MVQVIQMRIILKLFHFDFKAQFGLGSQCTSLVSRDSAARKEECWNLLEPDGKEKRRAS